MTCIANKGEGVSVGDSAPIYDNVKPVASFLSKEIGQKLALCAKCSPCRWDAAYVDCCFRSYEDLVDSVNHEICCDYLRAILLVIKSEDSENQDDRVSTYILKHAKEWFNVYMQG